MKPYVRGDKLAKHQEPGVCTGALRDASDVIPHARPRDCQQTEREVPQMYKLETLSCGLIKRGKDVCAFTITNAARISNLLHGQPTRMHASRCATIFSRSLPASILSTITCNKASPPDPFFKKTRLCVDVRRCVSEQDFLHDYISAEIVGPSPTRM